MAENGTTTILYQSDQMKTICSIKFAQRGSSEPGVSIYSPNEIISPSLYKFKSSSTTMNIFISPIQSPTYCDYINSIALCMMRSGLDYDYLIGYSEGESILLFSPVNNKISFLYLMNNDVSLEYLKSKCIEIYNKLISQVDN